jgi:hypothetical protein
MINVKKKKREKEKPILTEHSSAGAFLGFPSIYSHYLSEGYI